MQLRRGLCGSGGTLLGGDVLVRDRIRKKRMWAGDVSRLVGMTHSRLSQARPPAVTNRTTLEGCHSLVAARQMQIGGCTLGLSHAISRDMDAR